MRTLALERVVRAPRADVFDWLIDTSNYQRIPVITRVTPLRPGNIHEYGVGARRLVVTPLARLTTEIVDCDPPHAFRYRLSNSAPLVRRQNGAVTLDDDPDGTRVFWRTQFESCTPLFSAFFTLALSPAVYAGLAGILATAERELRGY
ncbi:MAG: SRPBCC family protein [Nocardia sp.]|nr:SRPBCC family protein [Nocardia sp.]